MANINDAPTGSPVIVGAATEDKTLTVDTSGIVDADGLGAFSYQWLRDGAAITGATNDSLVLGDADVERAISLIVSYTDGRGTAERLTSAATAPVRNVNDAPAGRPVIAGTATEDQSLRVDTRSIADPDGLGAFSYQWLRDGAAITGATNDSLVLVDADVGRAISVMVSYTDGQGTREQLTSATTAPVVNVNDAPSGLPVIVGTAAEDQVLTAETSAVSDADGVGTFRYQWLRDGALIDGATSDRLLLSDADVGHSISVAVAYTDALGTAERLSSTGTATVANVDDAPSGRPRIVGVPTRGGEIAADTRDIADGDGVGVLAYQWFRGDVAVAGATGSTYRLATADLGQAIRVVVSYTDGHGHLESLASEPSAAVADDRAPIGTPRVVGSAVAGQVLAIEGFDPAAEPAVAAYQWLRDGVPIAGASGSSLRLGTADIGASLSVEVSLKYADGSVLRASSVPTATVVAGPAPAATPGRLTIEDGQALVLGPASLSTLQAGAGSELRYAVSEVRNGRFESSLEPGVAISAFSQADLAAGRIRFIHSAGAGVPSFLVTLTDAGGGSATLRPVIAFLAPADATPFVSGRIAVVPGPTTPVTAVTTATAEAAAPSLVAVTGNRSRSSFDTDLLGPPAAGVEPTLSLQRSAVRLQVASSNAQRIDLVERLDPGEFSLRLAELALDPALSGRSREVAPGERVAEFGPNRVEGESWLSSDATVRVAGASFGAGVVWWALRVGGLFTSLLASLPAWKQLDLLPILRDDEDEEEDDPDAGVDEDALAREERALDEVLGSSRQGRPR